MQAALRQDDGFDGRADAAYEALVRAHGSLTEMQSAALNARLILILANEVGYPRLRAAIDLALRTMGPDRAEAPAPVEAAWSGDGS